MQTLWMSKTPEGDVAIVLENEGKLFCYFLFAGVLEEFKAEIKDEAFYEEQLKFHLALHSEEFTFMYPNVFEREFRLIRLRLDFWKEPLPQELLDRMTYKEVLEAL